MKVGATNNNNVAFGKFNVIIPNEKEALESYKLVNRLISGTMPPISREIVERKRTAGFINNLLGWNVEVKGKNVGHELLAANTFIKAGFEVSPVQPSPANRVENAIKFLVEQSQPKTSTQKPLNLVGRVKNAIEFLVEQLKPKAAEASKGKANTPNPLNVVG